MRSEEEIESKLKKEEKRLEEELMNKFNCLCNELPGLKYTENYLHIEKNRITDELCLCRERIKLLEWVLGD